MISVRSWLNWLIDCWRGGGVDLSVACLFGRERSSFIRTCKRQSSALAVKGDRRPSVTYAECPSSTLLSWRSRKAYRSGLVHSFDCNLKYIQLTGDRSMTPNG